MHCWLPESGSSGRVGSTSHVNVTLATAAVEHKWRLLSATKATIVIVAILSSSTKVARCWRQRRTFWRIKDCPDSIADCVVIIIIIMLEAHDGVDCSGDDDYDDELKKDDNTISYYDWRSE